MSAANIFMLVSKLFKMEQRKTGKRKTYCWKEEGETLRKKKNGKEQMAVRQEGRQAGPPYVLLLWRCVLSFFVAKPFPRSSGFQSSCGSGFSDTIWNRIIARIWNWTWASGILTPEASITFLTDFRGPSTYVFPLHFCRFRGQSGANAHGKLDSTARELGWLASLLSSWKGVKKPIPSSGHHHHDVGNFVVFFSHFFYSKTFCHFYSLPFPLTI